MLESYFDGLQFAGGQITLRGMLSGDGERMVATPWT
jgi:hypothetical protein